MRKIFWEKTALGIELGSTRIKATIIDDNFNVIAEGQSEWENRYENKYWTYSLEDIHNKLQEAYKNLVSLLTMIPYGFALLATLIIL